MSPVAETLFELFQKLPKSDRTEFLSRLAQPQDSEPTAGQETAVAAPSFAKKRGRPAFVFNEESWSRFLSGRLAEARRRQVLSMSPDEMIRSVRESSIEGAQ